MAKVIGRKVLPTDLNEEYVLQTLGIEHVAVPRKLNPYFVARRLAQAAKPCPHQDFLFHVVSRSSKPMPPFGAPPAPVLPVPLGEALGEAAE